MTTERDLDAWLRERSSPETEAFIRDSLREVACERRDGTVNVHKASETCEMCRTKTESEV